MLPDEPGARQGQKAVQASSRKGQGTRSPEVEMQAPAARLGEVATSECLTGCVLLSDVR